MRGLAFWFFLTGVVCLSVGMVWGLVMSISGDHSLFPAHAHLNLVSGVMMVLFGIYYHLTPRAAVTRLASVHFAIGIVTAVTFGPGIAIVISNGTETLAQIGSLCALATMLIFLFMVARFGLGDLRQNLPGQPTGRIGDPAGLPV